MKSSGAVRRRNLELCAPSPQCRPTPLGEARDAAPSPHLSSPMPTLEQAPVVLPRPSSAGPLSDRDQRDFMDKVYPYAQRVAGKLQNVRDPERLAWEVAHKMFRAWQKSGGRKEISKALIYNALLHACGDEALAVANREGKDMLSLYERGVLAGSPGHGPGGFGPDSKPPARAPGLKSSGTADANLMGDEEATIAHMVAMAMNEPDRTVLQLARIAELSNAEISEELHMALGTVASARTRAFKRFRCEMMPYMNYGTLPPSIAQEFRKEGA